MPAPPELAAAADDLIYLRKWHYLYLRDWKSDPPTGEIRRGSGILQRLLGEQELLRAWHAARFDGQPQIVATDLAATIKAYNSPVPPDFALAGAARYNAAEAAGIAVAKEKPAASSPGQIFRTYSLSDYLASASIVMGRTVIVRREVIQYMAHVRGEANPLAAKERKRDREMLERMSSLEARAEAYRKDGMLLEFISIGQTLAQTPDVEKLIRRAATHA